MQEHPGLYVRRKIIPTDMTVVAAAEKLAMSRPALNNFLLGKAALSTDMALRLEREFGADAEKLVMMQARYDIYTMRLMGTRK